MALKTLKEARRAKALKVAHPLIAETACSLANAVFEEAMSKNNDMFRAIKKQNEGKSTEDIRKAFVMWLAPDLIGDARATLAGMLGTSLDEGLKSRIYDALMRDATLTRHRSPSPTLLSQTKH